MNCPFPGMDPYLERPRAWPDFHDRLIAYIVSEIQPLLRPRYMAVAQDRLYVMETKRGVRPDVAVVETALSRPLSTTTAVADTPTLVIRTAEEEFREPFIEILEADTERIVTAIEVLSPANKAQGQGRRTYLKKREEYLHAGANLVEIDLLRDGAAMNRLDNEERSRLGRHHYLITVHKVHDRQLFYAVRLEERLPRIPVPLAPPDDDVVLDLQAAFARTWNDGAYPQLLRYHEPPPGALTVEEVEWCRARVANYKRE